ncbi:MAG: flippase [Candidatus Shapirobacteria bacterium]|nr:flippase [Candidatus Shapirobacteria bacterium]
MSLSSLLFRNQSTRQTLIKNTFWLGLIEFFSKIIMFFVTILIVRSFGPNEFGKLNLAMSYAAMIMVFSDLGLNTITAREIARHKEEKDKYLSNIFTIRLLVSVVIWLGTFLFSANKLVLLVVTFNLVQNFSSLLCAAFSGLEAMQYNFISRFIYYFGILASVIAVTRVQGSPEKLITFYIIASFITFILTFSMLKFKKINLKLTIDLLFWKKILKETLPLLGMTITGVIYLNIDSILIGRYFGPEQVGLYQSAYKILFAFQSINIINSSLFPRISSLIAEKKYIILNKLNFIVVAVSLFVLIPLGIFISIFASQIMKIIYGTVYVSASPALIFLIWSGIIFYFRNFINNLLIANNKQKQVFYSILLGTTINVMFNLFITPRFNYIYASMAMVLSEIIILTYSTLLYVKNKK